MNSGGNRRGAAAVILLLVGAALSGCEWGPPDLVTRPPGAIAELNVDGHSLAYGTAATQDGPGGTGPGSMLARAIDLKENNYSVPGAMLQASGVWTDGWGKVLETYAPRPGAASGERPPGLSLLWYGANDITWIGPDLPLAEETYRTIISRHRADAVYEAGKRSDGSITADEAWAPLDVDLGEGSGGSVLTAKRPGEITIEIEAGELADGSTVALGFVQEKGSSARYTVDVDGERAGVLDTSGELTPTAFDAGYVFRIKDLSDESHTIELRADAIDGAAYFDYWQVEPPEPDPVVLIEQYLLPGSESITRAQLQPNAGKDELPHIPTDRDIRNLNEMTRSLAREFGERVMTVDTAKVIGKSPRLIAADTIHLTQAGYDAVTEALLEALAASPFADELELPRRYVED